MNAFPSVTIVGAGPAGLCCALWLVRAGVKVTVSTDDPPFFHTTMRREYEELSKAFGWDENVFRELNQTALDAAFCDADTKAKVAKRLEQA